MTGELNYLQLILHASVAVQAVMLVLLLASLWSWWMIFRKRAILGHARREADSFEERFWSGADLAQLYKEVQGRREPAQGLAAVFEAGFREFMRLRQRRHLDGRALLEGAQRQMRVSLSREVDRLEHHLNNLATIGSISPYIGLFGTVWGIMIAFHGLGSTQQATISTVAPAISEALIATAMGLFAAIPAVIFYNRFINQVERLELRYQAFQDEFSTILQRQAHVDDAVTHH